MINDFPEWVNNELESNSYQLNKNERLDFIAKYREMISGNINQYILLVRYINKKINPIIYQLDESNDKITIHANTAALPRSLSKVISYQIKKHKKLIRKNTRKSS